ncbi:hypothetical protein [Sphingomonas sp.]|jgi:hypothetical protein|uniref:hypothetical protein n=1 Tax=Sphingomonas sp. TaxID=28214 RepID=UPI002DE8986C|nr:hypothetical protein [Sphingomonas sp.]
MRRSLAAFLLLAGCATAPLRPVPEALAPWTTTLRDSQPEDAFAAVYKIGPRRLVFVAAKHANRDDSLTFRLIRDAYASFRFEVVIAEGFATSRGANPPTVLNYAMSSKPRPDGFVEEGETVPTVVGAQQEPANLIGGEPDDLAVKQSVLAAKLRESDLLGFYVLRSIPQWISERKIADAADVRLKPLVEAELAKRRTALQLPGSVLATHEDWTDWYRRLNGKPLGQDFDTEEVGPLADGRFATNRIAYAVSRARDAHLHRLIIDHLNAGKSVLVVFGASHLLIHRPALDAVLGKPCYVGTVLTQGVAVCG